jgi:hypothetical protein
LGYGAPWRDMASQNWKWQKELFEESQKAYLISEYAIIGRQNPETEEAKAFINKDSYELPDERSALGFCFEDNEWELSQAFQSVCANVATRQLLKNDADGMLWCALWGGANNASYLKPIVDFHGYKKMAYYSLCELFQESVAFNANPDVLYCKEYAISPTLRGLKKNAPYRLVVEIIDENGVVLMKEYSVKNNREDGLALEEWSIILPHTGYYIVRYSLEEVSARALAREKKGDYRQMATDAL